MDGVADRLTLASQEVDPNREQHDYSQSGQSKAKAGRAVSSCAQGAGPARIEFSFYVAQIDRQVTRRLVPLLSILGQAFADYPLQFRRRVRSIAGKRGRLTSQDFR